VSSGLLGLPVERSLGKGEVETAFLSGTSRSVIEAEIERLIALLDAVDAQHADMEPDHDGEPEPIEAAGQPVTLAPPPVRAVQQHRPTRRQMAVAYRRNGDPIPANLRGLLGRVFA
jgi:hypothetical protein